MISNNNEELDDVTFLIAKKRNNPINSLNTVSFRNTAGNNTFHNYKTNYTTPFNKNKRNITIALSERVETRDLPVF